MHDVFPEPPARLRTYDPADWLSLVDQTRYDREAPRLSREDWLRQEARALWGRARLEWHDEHGGWPGGLTPIDLLREQMASRRRAVGEGRW